MEFEDVKDYFLNDSQTIVKEFISNANLLTFVYFPKTHSHKIYNLPKSFGPVPLESNDYPESVLSALNMSFDHKQKIRAAVRAIDEGKKSAQCTYEFHVDGMTNWVTTKWVSHFDSDGKPDYVLGYGYDITEEKNREKSFADQLILRKISENAMLFTLSFNVTEDSIVSKNGDPIPGGMSELPPCPKEMEEWVYSIEPEVKDQKPETRYVLLSAASQIPDEEERKNFILISCHAGLLRAWKKGDTEQIMNYGRMIEGKFSFVQTRIVLVSHPETQDVYAFFYTKDVTAQRRDEIVVETVLHQGCDFCALIDPKTNMATFRFMSERIRRVCPEWITGEIVCYDELATVINRLFAGKDKERLLKITSLDYLTEQLSNSEQFFTSFDVYYGNKAMHKQVQYRWLPPSNSRILAIQQDVTQIIEERRVQEVEIELRNKQLKEALASAEESNRAKSEFLSRISHDIRTPMNAIIGFTKLLLHDVDDPEKVRDKAQKVLTSSGHLLGLINDVLDMSRIESGNVQISPRCFKLRESVGIVESIMRPLFEKKNQNFDIIYSDVEHEGFMADDNRLEQILLNILSNAMKYTDDGGTISMHVRELPAATESMANIGFEIVDNGRGMSEEYQKILFTPFSREQPMGHQEVQGTGLGLAITKNLVNLMGGTISAKSVLGKGSAFKIIIPMQIVESEIQNPYEAEVKEFENAGEDVLRGLKILAAEDNALNAEILKEILKLSGAEVTIEENGKKAVEAFAKSQPGTYDLILMDIQMPVMDGYQATRAIRAMGTPAARGIPIIAMTANAFNEDVQKSLLCGMNAHITKPVDMNTLRETIQKNLSAKK